MKDYENLSIPIQSDKGLKMDKEATLARLQKINKMRENQQKFMDKEITYEEYKYKRYQRIQEKKDEIIAEKINLCEMLDAEMDHIKSEYINDNISEKVFNNKSDKIYKQVIEILC